jgi:hypothetical protein
VPKGVVTYVSPNFGMLVVSHDEGHTVVEMLGSEGEIVKGDVLFAEWTENGSETFRKSGEPSPFDAYFQGTWGDFRAAANMAFRTGGG